MQLNHCQPFATNFLKDCGAFVKLHEPNKNKQTKQTKKKCLFIEVTKTHSTTKYYHCRRSLWVLRKFAAIDISKLILPNENIWYSKEGQIIELNSVQVHFNKYSPTAIWFSVRKIVHFFRDFVLQSVVLFQVTLQRSIKTLDTFFSSHQFILSSFFCFEIFVRCI